jgi:hypothetical protein
VNRESSEPSVAARAAGHTVVAGAIAGITCLLVIVELLKPGFREWTADHVLISTLIASSLAVGAGVHVVARMFLSQATRRLPASAVARGAVASLVAHAELVSDSLARTGAVDARAIDALHREIIGLLPIANADPALLETVAAARNVYTAASAASTTEHPETYVSAAAGAVRKLKAAASH